MRPHRQQPTRLPHPWNSPVKNSGVGFHFPLQSMKVKSESEVAQSYPILRDLMDCMWMKAQHEGALTPSCILRKKPKVPLTARQMVCYPVNNSRGKWSSILQKRRDVKGKGALESREGTRASRRVEEGLSRVFSNITVQKHQFLGTQLSLHRITDHLSSCEWNLRFFP